MMNEEDEAFNEIERKAKQRMEAVRAAMRVEDDDIQEYKKPWVGLTEQEQGAIMENLNAYGKNLYEFARAVEAKLKEKNT
jgi:rubrerythrin